MKTNIEDTKEEALEVLGIEAVKKEDGSWSEVVVWDQERIEEFGGGCGVLVWSEEKGFQEVL